MRIARFIDPALLVAPDEVLKRTAIACPGAGNEPARLTVFVLSGIEGLLFITH
jgi:hypothetical protein